MSDALRALLDDLEGASALDAPERLRERIEALDRFDALWPVDGEAVPLRRGRSIRARLEAANAAQYGTIREAIRRGEGREALSRWWRAGDDGPPACGDAYDWRDELVGGVLSFGEPDEAAALAPEMVFYQPTPARHVLGMLDRLALGGGDVLVDLGAGLGHVPLLTAAYTGARGVGIEIEPAYVACARRCARELRLANARFVRCDARDADLSIGTVFYLYTPFTGTIMRSVLDALRREAGRRAFRVCSFGPCTALLAREPWLASDGAPSAERIAVFRTRC
jgi:hypothetical protein